MARTPIKIGKICQCSVAQEVTTPPTGSYPALLRHLVSLCRIHGAHPKLHAPTDAQRMSRGLFFVFHLQHKLQSLTHQPVEVHGRSEHRIQRFLIRCRKHHFRTQSRCDGLSPPMQRHTVRYFLLTRQERPILVRLIHWLPIQQFLR